MNRTGWMAVVGVVMCGLSVSWLSWRPASESALRCEPVLLGITRAGVVACGAKEMLSVQQALTVRQPIDLNRVSAKGLAKVPGVGKRVANAIVMSRVRRGRFTSWEQIDAVPGVGAGRLEKLKRIARIKEIDAGVW